jgi:hypothetical protein
MPTRLTIIEGVLAVLLVAGLAGFSTFAEWYEAWLRDYGPGWHEMAWPFPRDAFPAGKAWRNDELRLYVRPKLGFCGNCDTGVVEDSEVDRVTDIDLLDANFTPAQDGSRVRITDLVGRARLYRLKGSGGKKVLAEAIAVSFNCDLVVAIAVGDRRADAQMRKEVHQFIESNTVQVWLNKILEGR